MKMRKGFYLVELLVVMSVLPVICIVLDGLFRTLTFEIPRSSRLVQENTVMLGAVRCMRNDISAAKQLPESFDGFIAGDDKLLIEMQDGVVCYQIEDGRILRKRFASAGQSDSGDTTVWSMPHGKMQWQVWHEGASRYAVEIETCIEDKDLGHLKKKMANSHLFFVGACWGQEK